MRAFSAANASTTWMVKAQTIKYYAQSLGWAALFFAVACAVSNIVELIFVDFVHGNPHRSQANAIEMMWLYSPIIAIIAVAGFFLVYTIPQVFQAGVRAAASKIMRNYAPFLVLPVLPVTAVLTWYCWDYLTPSDFNLGINADPDWAPYQHGITPSRYFSALEFQLPVTLFSSIYCDASLLGWSRRCIILATLVLSVAAGAMYGYHLAENQYRFLGSS